jgi:hypothetical protein
MPSAIASPPETVIGALKDADDYGLRTATTRETGRFEIQADHLTQFSRSHQVNPASRDVVDAIFGNADIVSLDQDLLPGVLPSLPPKFQKVTVP